MKNVIEVNLFFPHLPSHNNAGEGGVGEGKKS